VLAGVIVSHIIVRFDFLGERRATPTPPCRFFEQ
jgi:hypothetical protein